MWPLSTRSVTLLSILTALCIGIQLTPRPPNVEFTSVLVFLVGAVFGTPLGVGLGVLVMFINGFFSPYGFAGLMLPFQVAGMVIVGLGGGLYGRQKQGVYRVSSLIEAAVLGAFLTLVFDLITNFGVAVSFWLTGVPLFLAFVNAMISGAPFLVVHVASNANIFAALFFPLSNALQKLLGGEVAWKREPSST